MTLTFDAKRRSKSVEGIAAKSDAKHVSDRGRNRNVKIRKVTMASGDEQRSLIRSPIADLESAEGVASPRRSRKSAMIEGEAGRKPSRRSSTKIEEQEAEITEKTSRRPSRRSGPSTQESISTRPEEALQSRRSSRKSILIKKEDDTCGLQREESRKASRQSSSRKEEESTDPEEEKRWSKRISVKREDEVADEGIPSRRSSRKSIGEAKEDESRETEERRSRRSSSRREEDSTDQEETRRPSRKSLVSVRGDGSREADERRESRRSSAKREEESTDQEATRKLSRKSIQSVKEDDTREPEELRRPSRKSVSKSAEDSPDQSRRASRRSISSKREDETSREGESPRLSKKSSGQREEEAVEDSRRASRRSSSRKEEQPEQEDIRRRSKASTISKKNGDVPEQDEARRGSKASLATKKSGEVLEQDEGRRASKRSIASKRDEDMIDETTSRRKSLRSSSSKEAEDVGTEDKSRKSSRKSLQHDELESRSRKSSRKSSLKPEAEEEKVSDRLLSEEKFQSSDLPIEAGEESDLESKSYKQEDETFWAEESMTSPQEEDLLRRKGSRRSRDDKTSDATVDRTSHKSLRRSSAENRKVGDVPVEAFPIDQPKLSAFDVELARACRQELDENVLHGRKGSVEDSQVRRATGGSIRSRTSPVKDADDLGKARKFRKPTEYIGDSHSLPTEDECLEKWRSLPSSTRVSRRESEKLRRRSYDDEYSRIRADPMYEHSRRQIQIDTTAEAECSERLAELTAAASKQDYQKYTLDKAPETQYQSVPSRRIYENNNNPDDLRPGKTVVVYQMTARYATFGGLRVAGGVRVLIDVSAKQGYVQIISLLSEVFVTHYISTLTFLNSTSAAGVAWCAVIVEPTKLAEPANNVSCSQSVYDSGQDKCRDSAPEQQQQVSDVSRGKIDTAHVVFCDPYQAHRFRTVLETLKCAISDEGCLAVPCVPPPTTCPCTPCVPCTIVEPDLQAHLPYCNPCPVQCQRPAMSPGNCASLYSPSASLHQQPPAMYTGSCPPIPTNEPPGGIYPPNLTPGQAGQLSTSPGTPTAGMPYPNTPVYESSMGIDHSSAADLLTNPVDITGSNNLAPCDPPSAPMTPNSANAGNYAQSTSVCVPYDPYAYENCQGKILFNSNACLVKLGKDKSWVDMQKGTVKIVQCPSGMGYSIVLENVNKSLSIYHFIRPDTVFEPAPKTQYGFVYNTANFSDGCGNEEYFLLSFQCESHAEKFKAIVDYIHCVQMMSCGNDNCNNVRSISISQWEAGSSTSRDSNHRYSSSRLSHTRGARVS